jgi:hypothetical protein
MNFILDAFAKFFTGQASPNYFKKHHIPEELMARGGPLMDIDE